MLTDHLTGSKKYDFPQEEPSASWGCGRVWSGDKETKSRLAVKARRPYILVRLKGIERAIRWCRHYWPYRAL